MRGCCLEGGVKEGFVVRLGVVTRFERIAGKQSHSFDPSINFNPFFFPFGPKCQCGRWGYSVPIPMPMPMPILLLAVVVPKMFCVEPDRVESGQVE